MGMSICQFCKGSGRICLLFSYVPCECVESAPSSDNHGLEMVQIPKGSFLMGSPEAASEKPPHDVKLEAFSMAQTPVTNAQYALYLEACPDVGDPHHWRDERYNHPNQPIVGVSWYGAQAYCTWAGLQLPTEAQWEYACRAGTTTRYHSGDTEEDLDRVAWYEGNSALLYPHVGLKEPNAWGLYDMHGNVYEWCGEIWSSDYAEASHRAGDGWRDGLAIDGASSNLRAVRGGHRGYYCLGVRSASRGRFPYDFRIGKVGFRPVGKVCS